MALNGAWKSGRVQYEGTAGFPPEAACSIPVKGFMTRARKKCELTPTSTHGVTSKMGVRKMIMGAMQLTSATYHFVKFIWSSREYGSLNPADTSGIEAMSVNVQKSTCHCASRTSCASKNPLISLVPVVVSAWHVGLHCFLCTRPGTWPCNSRYGRVYRALGTPDCTSSARLCRLSRIAVLRPQDLLRLGHQQTIVRLT